MNNVVIIPCYRRPEYLQICLEHIVRADMHKQMYYLFCLDSGYDKANLEVIRKFDLNGQITYRGHSTNKLMKQSYNLLMGYKSAASMLNINCIFLIEEDILISNDLSLIHI